MLTRARHAGSVLAALFALSAAACARPVRPAYSLAQPGEPGAAGPAIQAGYASWYGGKLAGRRTANGERFDPSEMTAAHRTLPFGTWVEVTRVDTGGRVRVRITDRGPFGHAERIIDLSRAAAERIDMVSTGVAPVELRLVPGP